MGRNGGRDRERREGIRCFILTPHMNMYSRVVIAASTWSKTSFNRPRASCTKWNACDHIIDTMRTAAPLIPYCRKSHVAASTGSKSSVIFSGEVSLFVLFPTNLTPTSNRILLIIIANSSSLLLLKAADYNAPHPIYERYGHHYTNDVWSFNQGEGRITFSV